MQMLHKLCKNVQRIAKTSHQCATDREFSELFIMTEYAGFLKTKHNLRIKKSSGLKEKSLCLPDFQNKP